MEKAFVVSDIHGCYDPFKKLLEYWDQSMKLVILGDLIDRGGASKQVVQEVMKLKETYKDQLVVLKGNHEDMFLRFLQNPVQMGDIYFFNGGRATVKDFIGERFIMHRSCNDLADLVQERAKDEVNFIRSLPLYKEFGEVLFVHAGIDPNLPDWRDTSEECFVWTRDMKNHNNNTGKVIVYGHTPTKMIHSDQSSDIWVSKDCSYINIDGGCAYGGQLNAIIVNAQGEIEQTFHVIN